MFEILIAEGAAGVENLRSTRQQENVQLEFKTKSNPENGELSKEDRKNLGILLSAFANSNGGLIVWGIVAKKNEDDVDCACELAPISDLEKFKSEVERSVSQLIMPRHDGIQIEAIPKAPAATSGYLLVHVERSERRPHRCEAPGERQYLKRSGDSSIAMEHFDIEDSFKRLVVPRLMPEFRLTKGSQRPGPKDSRFASLNIRIALKNISTVSARDPYFVFDNASNFNPPGHAGGPANFFGGADTFIHPELSIRVCQLVHLIQLPARPPSELSISYRFGCYNALPTSGVYVVSPDEILDIIN